jgi:hypothetical protein
VVWRGAAGTDVGGHCRPGAAGTGARGHRRPAAGGRPNFWADGDGVHDHEEVAVILVVSESVEAAEGIWHRPLPEREKMRCSAALAGVGEGGGLQRGDRTGCHTRGPEAPGVWGGEGGRRCSSDLTRGAERGTRGCPEAAGWTAAREVREGLMR